MTPHMSIRPMTAVSKAALKGGGTKKVLYTLNTIRRIGLKDSAKALNAHNACKACALGMGGQMGGMTNELGEFPSVCNKSVQAQSTDIQPPIPEEIFAHTLDELRELTGREMETLGRLNTPLFKPAGDTRYRPLDWDEAMALAAGPLKACDPDETFFYASGRSSNEAGFLFQLLARAYGTNNVTNCSYYCHQATSVALKETIGTGTSTVELADLTLSDLIFVIGANPASNHPRFIHKLKGVRDRGGAVIVINPAREPGLVKFAVPKSPASMLKGGDAIATLYLQPRIGEDMALFKAIALALIEQDALAAPFIADYCEGFDAYRTELAETSIDALSARCGVPLDDIRQAAHLYARSQAAVFAWGMGMTHHVHGVENIESIANLALLRGMVGRPGAGLLPLRGHSNVQGIGTIGVKPVLDHDVFERMEQSFGVSLPRAEGLDTMACMQAAYEGRMKAGVIMGGNLFAANPNTRWARQALDQVPFKLFLTTTLNQGHVNGVDSGESLILPVTARDEEWQPTTQESMFNFVRLSDGGIHRLDGVRPESVILADLATALLPHSAIPFGAFKTHSELRKVIAAIVPGMEGLASIDVARQEFHIKGRVLHEPVFGTDTGKARFRTLALPDTAPTQFVLTTMRSEGQFNSIVYEETDSYRGTQSRWCVLMNKDDIAALGLGERATIRSAHGEMRDVAVEAYDLPRGNLMAYYPEANVLTGTAVDPRSKTPSFKATPVTITA